MHRMDWDGIRIFLAVVEEGSMSAAAQVLGLSQPTISRQISALEEKFGFNLFDRSSNGLKVTAMGESLLESAQQTARGVECFLRKVNAGSDNHEGHVRLASGEVMAYHFLPEALKAFNQQYPNIEVEILVENKDVNLNKREADILISRSKPTQPDLVVSFLHQEALGFFAHHAYLKEKGRPKTVQEMHSNQFQRIGYDQLDMYIQAAEQFSGRILTRSQFSFRTDSFKMQLELARAQVGIAVIFRQIAQRYPELVCMLPDAQLPVAQWWLVCHRDVHINPRIRNLMVFLSQWFHGDKARLLSNI
ncbi:LysR family transcriptional regulator [Photobacterium nomapromontoriensis]|uniref:LysR family transcriptional regulator n=1 Tax=Photobacterium nomapromontoriensis TaxID=2910237 RepID=UPI003D0C0FC1